jgi:hypothetical protein
MSSQAALEALMPIGESPVPAIVCCAIFFVFGVLAIYNLVVTSESSLPNYYINLSVPLMCPDMHAIENRKLICSVTFSRTRNDFLSIELG